MERQKLLEEVEIFALSSINAMALKDRRRAKSPSAVSTRLRESLKRDTPSDPRRPGTGKELMARAIHQNVSEKMDRL